MAGPSVRATRPPQPSQPSQERLLRWRRVSLADLPAYQDQLLRLLAWPDVQRWATQVEGRAEYPHSRGRLVASDLDRHLSGHQTEARLWKTCCWE